MRKIFLLLFFFQICFVKAAYEDQHARGWHWYEELKQEKETQEALQNLEKQSDLNPIKELQIFKKKVEELKAIDVMDPTFKNVKAYIEIQKILLERSSQFAQRWLEVIYLRPELDYTLKHPTSQAARHVYLDIQKKQMEAQIKVLSQTHGLFFFFSSQCAYCQKFAPIVKGFSQKYGWPVLAVSMDSSRLPGFPQAQNDNGAARKLGIKVFPALMAVNPQAGQVIPLSYGMSTYDQIEDGIRVLLLRKTP